MKNRSWYAVSVVAAIAIFQFFLRYQYEHLAGGSVMRIDRLTASSCYMPCLPAPAPAPTEAPTSSDESAAYAGFVRIAEDQDQLAINTAKNTPEAANLMAISAGRYSWTAKPADPLDQVVLNCARQKSGLVSLLPRNFVGTECNEVIRVSKRPNPYDPNPYDALIPNRARPGAGLSPPNPGTALFQTKLVCYCDAKGFGWSWEVHTDTGKVFFVNDNADLMKKYGITRSH